LGVALGLWGAKHTRFEWHQGKLHYIPHTYAGLIVFALFLGRMLYRLLAIWQSGGATGDPAAGASPFGQLSHNPLTLGVFFVLIGYFVCYYGFVLKEFKQGKREDLTPEAVVNLQATDRNKPEGSAS
jgi:hypothetical protein